MAHRAFCRYPQCWRTAHTRGLCNKHYQHWYDTKQQHVAHWLDPYILPAFDRQWAPICLCPQPLRHYLPPFDAPGYRTCMCDRCGMPTLDGLTPAAQQRFAHLLQQSTSDTPKETPCPTTPTPQPQQQTTRPRTRRTRIPATRSHSERSSRVAPPSSTSS